MLFSLSLPTIFCRSDVTQDGAKEAGGEEDGVVIKSKKTVNFLSFNSLYPVDFRLAFYFINKTFHLRKVI